MNRRLVVLTVAALTVAVVGLTIALIVVASDSGSDSTSANVRKVPTVTRMDQTEAEALLSDAGFEWEVESVSNDNPGVGPGQLPPGSVVEQDPPAGSLADVGSTVTLTVAAAS